MLTLLVVSFCSVKIALVLHFIHGLGTLLHLSQLVTITSSTTSSGQGVAIGKLLACPDGYGTDGTVVILYSCKQQQLTMYRSNVST